MSGRAKRKRNQEEEGEEHKLDPSKKDSTITCSGIILHGDTNSSLLASSGGGQHQPRRHSSEDSGHDFCPTAKNNKKLCWKNVVDRRPPSLDTISTISCWRPSCDTINGCLKLNLFNLPNTITDLDFSGHHLSAQQITTICNFVVNQKDIRSLNLAGTGLTSPHHHRGTNTCFQDISTLLSKNNASLRRLDLSNNEISWGESFSLYKGCQKNDTLEELILNHPTDNCSHLDGTSLATMLSLWSGLFQTKSSIKRLSIGSSSMDLMMSDHLVDLWGDICEKQENLISLGCRNLESSNYYPSSMIPYWLTLNRYKIRQITRDGHYHACRQALLQIIATSTTKKPDGDDQRKTKGANNNNTTASAAVVYYLIRNNPHIIVSNSWNGNAELMQS